MQLSMPLVYMLSVNIFTIQENAVLLSGWFQVALGVMILIDVFRRIMMEREPLSVFMNIVGLIALTANVICLRLIDKHKDGDVHMRAS
ncbi:MAG: hypothetical protein HRT92_07460 [Piscirickettsiaceae bacterium]|nr:hypothetical protein [Piscirickettsiaceae bacterium]